MVAGALGISGAWLGLTVPGGGIENPKGFFENIFLREAVNKQILTFSGADPLGVKSLPNLGQLPEITNLDQLIRSNLEREGYDFQRRWLFKEPKLTLIWPNFANFFPNAHWVIVRREKSQIVQSCLHTSFMRRQNSDPVFWQLWVEQYLSRLKILKQTELQWTEIWPQKFIEGDFSELFALVQKLDLNWREEALHEFITPEYWHF